MRIVTALCAVALVVPLSVMADSKIFPYKYSISDLPNGLRVITVPTDYPNIVATYIVVEAGSRNEVEPGKSGFAHLFEHLMFRGTEKFSSDAYDDIMKKAGADRNAYTSDDLTVYHAVFSREDLEKVMMLEADRFQNLKVPVDLFKTETKAVLGEYNKNSADPTRKLLEVLRDTAFKGHTYKHTTMGFIADIENMPNLYDYSLEFFRRYYRPEYTTIIVVGDVKRDDVVGIVKKYWGEWKRGDYTAKIPVEPEQPEERKAHIDWPTPVLPWVMVAYKGPAYSDRENDMAAMDVISHLGFSETSELYQRMVIKEQKVDTLLPTFLDRRDPYLLIVSARVKNPGDVEYVQNEIVKTFDSFKADNITKERLDAVKSHIRYSFGLRLDNSEAIAATLAPYVALRRTPETLNMLFQLYASVTPGDVRSVAKKYFVATKRTIVTLASKEKH